MLNVALKELGHHKKLKIGILGGSFNPAHDGHVHLSKQAKIKLGLHQVWWLISPQNPLKSAKDLAPLSERVKEARNLIDTPYIYIDSIESELRDCYTVNTIKYLQKIYPHIHFVWLMGADNLVQMPQWEDWNTIIHNIPIAVFPRPDFTIKAGLSKMAQKYKKYRLGDQESKRLAISKPPAWALLSMPLRSVSSTAIRAKAK